MRSAFEMKYGRTISPNPATAGRITPAFLAYMTKPTPIVPNSIDSIKVVPFTT